MIFFHSEVIFDSTCFNFFGIIFFISRDIFLIIFFTIGFWIIGVTGVTGSALGGVTGREILLPHPELPPHPYPLEIGVLGAGTVTTGDVII